MRVLLLTLAAALLAQAADERQLALALQAQTEFDRVELAPVPRLPDASACEQSQAALLPVAARAEVPLIHYRKGYCALVAAALASNPAQFNAAAAEFQQAIDNWPARRLKDAPTEPVSAALPVLAAIAHLNAAPTPETIAAARTQIAAAEAAPSCTSNFMPADSCRRWLEAGRAWLGWIALRDNDLSGAASNFGSAGDSAWSDFAGGQTAFAKGNYTLAAADYRRAVDSWHSAAEDPAPSLYARVAPRPVMTDVLADLGGAQLLAGDPQTAIATLDQAVKAGPTNARALFLRARAKEKAGDSEAALADYNLASRTAFAQAKDLASGEAHLYRGILMYRRKNFSAAEDEFSSALNFEIPPTLRGDAVAWRHLAAVAAGACDASRQLLLQSLPSVSPYFPRNEAENLIAACPVTSTARRGLN